MNHVYRLVWSTRHSKFVVAHEKTRSNGRASSKISSSVASVLLSSLLVAPLAWAAPPTANTLPTGAQVTAGTAAISTSGNTMNVQQSTQRAAINWTNFSIGSNATVNFLQPNASAVVLNRVVGNEQSVINGALNANGQVFLLNSNGVLFGQGAQVNVGGLVASTLNQSDADFMAGRSTFERTGSRASVINLGTINAADGGYVALLGNQVSNQGVITARMGTAALAAGDKVSLNFNGNSLVGVTIDQGTLDALVENKQAIYADGGTVVLTAKAADAVLGSLVNNTGEIRAQTVANQEGKIYLLGDMENGTVKVDGTLDARAPNGGNGGFVETSAAHVKVADSARVTTLANNGQNGTWLIDPNDFTVAASGGDMTGAAVGTALAGGNFTIQSAQGATSGNGDIFVNDNVTWTSGNALTLSADRNISINTTVDASGGSGGKLVLQYGQGAVASGNTSSYSILPSVKINLQAGQNFDTKLGSNGSTVNWTVITALGTETDAITAGSTNSLQGLAYSSNSFSNITGNYVLGADIDASATASWNNNKGFKPIGNESASTLKAFAGKFDGLGHNIDNLTAYNGGGRDAGLFGRTWSNTSISNLSLSNVAISNTVTDLSSANYAGALVGNNAGSKINNVRVTSGTVSLTLQSALPVGQWASAGGMVGQLSGADILNSSSAANVSVNASTSNVVSAGGFVGRALRRNISNSYSTGSVTLNGGANYVAQMGEYTAVGGFVGISGGSTFQNSYATGTVGGTTTGAAGGFLGFGFYSAGATTLNRVFVANSITASSATNIGGLVGLAGSYAPSPNSDVAVTNSFWDTTTSGQTIAYGSGGSTFVGATGKTTADMQAAITFLTANPNSDIWDIVTDTALVKDYPTLRWSVSGATYGTTIWVIGTKLAVTYTLTGANKTYGQTFTLPTPTYTGGTPTGTSTVKVYDANNNDVTSQAVAGTLAAGTYTVKDALTDTNYQIASSGNTNGVLVITAASSSSNSSTADVERQVSAATHAPREITRPQINSPRDSEAGKTKQFTNVAVVPNDVTLPFNKEDPLAVLSSPDANEPTQTVTLADAKKMIKQSASSATAGGGTGGDREVRVPVSRNSLAEIVNGGVKLPTGVEQQLFVVKAN